MPILNKDKCFAQQPVESCIEKEHTVVQQDWLKSLYKLAAKQLGLNDELRDEDGHTAVDDFIKEAEKHTGIFSTYTHKDKLLDSLKILYIAFTSAQVTDDQKTMIALKIQEGVYNCTPGFHTRIQFALELLNMPKNLDGLLAKTRFSIVEQAASITLKNDTQSVHGNNRFFVMARNMGFGVRPINNEDTYIDVGGVDFKKMERVLNDAFAKHYGLFGILNSLREQLESIVREKGYSGRKETGYPNEEQERFSELIKPFITIGDDTLWQANIDEESYVKTVFGIDWQNVKRVFLKKIRDEKYIELSPQELNLFDSLPTITNNEALISFIPNAHELAQCLVFFSEWTIEQKAALVMSYVNDKSETEQEVVLSVLENQAAQITKELKSYPELRTLYFRIAIQKNKSADVRACIEQGADMNAALGLLFSEDHKTETLYWLYDNKNLIEKITPAGMQTIITDGKYKDKTIEEILKSTKKGREILSFSKNKSIVMSEGFFKRPDPLATQLGQYVAFGDLTKAEKILQDHPDLIKKLLSEKVTVTDYSGRKFKHKTALQLALCAWDVKLHVSSDPEKNDPDAMCEMLTKYMIQSGEEGTLDVYRQYNAIFPEGHQAYFKIQKPFDFGEIIKAFADASSDDVQTALDLIQPNNTTLWAALQKFRKEFTVLSKKEMVWNPQHLLKAFEEYENQYSKFGGRHDSPKNMLFWRQIIGYTQRFLPANVAMDVAQGLYYRVGMLEEPKRQLSFRDGGGAVFPVRQSLSGIGYEYAAAGRGAGARAGVGRWLTGLLLSPALLTELMSSKNSNIGKLMQPGSNPQPASGCLIL